MQDCVREALGQLNRTGQCGFVSSRVCESSVVVLESLVLREHGPFCCVSLPSSAEGCIDSKLQIC